MTKMAAKIKNKPEKEELGLHGDLINNSAHM